MRRGPPLLGVRHSQLTRRGDQCSVGLHGQRCAYVAHRQVHFDAVGMLDLEDHPDVDDAVAPVVIDLKLALDQRHRKALSQGDVAPRTDRRRRQRPRRAAAEDRGAEPSQVLVGDQARLPRRPRTPLRDPWGECGTSHDEFVLVGQRRRHVDRVAAEHVGRREQVLAVEPDVTE